MSDLDIEVQNFTADLVAAMLAARKRGLPQTMISEALRKEADTLRCPCCGEVLKESTEKCKYETLIDHVEDPNRDSPERTFFFCPNDQCALKKDNAFFDRFGDIYPHNKTATDWCIYAFH